MLLDGFTAIGAVAVLGVIMLRLMGYQALLLFTPAFLIFLELAFQTCAGGSNDDDDGVQKSKPASLELTKVTFTRFLAVSVATISSGSPNKWTDWFLLFAAGAIVSGLAWRLLTRQIKDHGGKCQCCFVLHPFLRCNCYDSIRSNGWESALLIL